MKTCPVPAPDQTLLAARLMPFAVDGLITVGSVVLLQGGLVSWPGIGPGVTISLFANVESGIRYGWLAAVWAGIPAMSFAFASFILERWLKGQTAEGTGGTLTPDAVTTTSQGGLAGLGSVAMELLLDPARTRAAVD